VDTQPFAHSPVVRSRTTAKHSKRQVFSIVRHWESKSSVARRLVAKFCSASKATVLKLSVATPTLATHGLMRNPMGNLTVTAAHRVQRMTTSEAPRMMMAWRRGRSLWTLVLISRISKGNFTYPISHISPRNLDDRLPHRDQLSPSYLLPRADPQSRRLARQQSNLPVLLLPRSLMLPAALDGRPRHRDQMSLRQLPHLVNPQSSGLPQ